MSEVIDPSISRFEKWFSKKAGGGLAGFEIELLRSFLYFEIYNEEGK